MQDITYLRFANSDSSRSGTAATSSRSRSRWRRTSESTTAAASTTRRRPARRRPKPHPADARAGRHGASLGGANTDAIRDAKLDSFRRSLTQTRTAMCAASTRATARSRGGSKLHHGDVHGPPAGHSELALVRGPILHPRRQAAGGEGHRGARSSRALRKSGSAGARSRRRTRSSSAPIPTPGPSFCSRPNSRDRTRCEGAPRPALQGAVRRPARAL